MSKEYKYEIGQIVNDLEVLEQIKIPNGKYFRKGYKLKCIVDGYIQDKTEASLLKGTKCVRCKQGVKEYKYEIGQEINNLKILDQVRLRNGRYTQKGYKVQCLMDGYINEVAETKLTRGDGCPVCANQIIVKGINDISTLASWMVEYFVNKKEAYTNTLNSNKKVDMICPKCGFKKKAYISNIYRQGFSCNRCGDGVPYPEKFIFSLLNQLNLDFLPQLNKTTLEWCENKKYDFYIPSLNCIIETHGEQHYTNSFKHEGSRTLEEEQENDRQKEILAKDNGIKHYIVLDCRNSTESYIKKSVLESELKDILPLDKIDFFLCNKEALKSKVYVVAELYNKGETIKSISLLLKNDRHTISKYIKKAREVGAVL